MEKLQSIENLYEVFIKSSGVCTDTRNVKKNAIFFALKGESFNGNLYARKAIELGCSFVVVDELIEDSLEGFLVDDVLQTLQELANFHRQKFKIPILAMSGSNGKTTSKELLLAVLSKKFKTHATKGNLNNHIGVPLTLLAAPIDSEIIIVEMGANHQREIDFLCQIAEPNFGFLTNIGKAHLEGFGGVEGVKKGKTELFKYLNQFNGVTFFNNNEISLQEFKRLPLNSSLYGEGTGINVIDFEQKDFALQIDFLIDGSEYACNAQLFGEYNVNNVLTAIAIGRYFEVPIKDTIAAVEEYNPDSNRSQVKISGKGNKLILDAYNANPTSMKNAIQQFGKTSSSNSVYILGDMLELGDLTDDEHLGVLELLSDLKGEKMLVGPNFGKFSNDYSFGFYRNTKELKAYLLKNKILNTDVLIKGSRGIALEGLLDAL